MAEECHLLLTLFIRCDLLLATMIPWPMQQYCPGRICWDKVLGSLAAVQWYIVSWHGTIIAIAIFLACVGSCLTTRQQLDAVLLYIAIFYFKVCHMSVTKHKQHLHMAEMFCHNLLYNMWSLAKFAIYMLQGWY